MNIEPLDNAWDAACREARIRRADEISVNAARAIFAARGNHSEMHLSEEELASIIAACMEKFICETAD